jgi:hypothetical protein
MKPARKRVKKNAIEQFLHNNLGYYMNPFNVHFSLPENLVLSVTAIWPENYPGPECYMEVCFEGTSVEEFGQITGVTSLEQIHFVSPQVLVELYNKGIAQLWVVVEIGEFYYELIYQKKESRLWMLDEDKNIERPVGRKLETPSDFFIYTRNYGKRHMYR